MASFQPLTLEVTSTGYAAWGVNYYISIRAYVDNDRYVWSEPQIKFSSANADREMGEMSLKEILDVHERADALYNMLMLGTSPHSWMKGGD